MSHQRESLSPCTINSEGHSGYNVCSRGVFRWTVDHFLRHSFLKVDIQSPPFALDDLEDEVWQAKFVHDGSTESSYRLILEHVRSLYVYDSVVKFQVFLPEIPGGERKCLCLQYFHAPQPISVDLPRIEIDASLDGTTLLLELDVEVMREECYDMTDDDASI